MSEPDPLTVNTSLGTEPKPEGQQEHGKPPSPARSRPGSHHGGSKRSQASSPARSTASTLSVVEGPDLTQLQSIVNAMKDTLMTLAGTCNDLGQQTAKVAELKPEIDSAHQIKHMRHKIRKHEKRQEERAEEMKNTLMDVLKQQISDQLRAELSKLVREEVENQVRDEVTRQMAIHIPILLDKQNREHRRQIAEIRKNLHNSESRRANSLLKSNNLFDPLHPLLRPNGEKCSIFPKTLAATFAVGPEVAKLLCQEFHLPETESKESNLNRFLHHIGVGFQMVATPMSMGSDGGIMLGD